MVELLLTKGADPNAPLPDGTTVLIAAVTRGDPYIVQWLLYAGADPHQASADSSTPLAVAAAEGKGYMQSILSGELVVVESNKPHGSFSICAAGGTIDEPILVPCKDLVTTDDGRQPSQRGVDRRIRP